MTLDTAENTRAFREVMEVLGARRVGLDDLVLRRTDASTVDWVHGTEALRGKRPLYPQLLQLQHIWPSAWQRAVLGEGMALAGGLLAMADLASAWSIAVLPLAVAGVVKVHDLLAGQLPDPDAALVVLGDEAYVLTQRQLARVPALR